MPLGIHGIENATKELTKNLRVAKENFVSNTSLRRTAFNRMLASDIPIEIVRKKTGRVSEAADADYIQTNLFEEKMSEALYGTGINAPETTAIEIQRQTGLDETALDSYLPDLNFSLPDLNFQETNEPDAKKSRFTFVNCNFNGVNFQ